MNLKTRVLLALLLLPGFLSLGQAATTYVGQIVQDVNEKQIGGTAVSTGAGTTDAGTQRVVLPTDQGPIPVTGSVSSASTTIRISDSAGASTVVGYQVGGGSVPVKVLNTVAVSQSGTWTVGLSAGSNQIGTVSGSTVTVYSGDVPLRTNLSQVGGSAIALGAAASAASVPVVIASDQATFPTSPLPIPTVNQSSQSVTGTSVQFFASNSNRQGIECISLCTNNDRVFCRFGGSALVTDSIIMEACSSWQPPAGISPTGSFACIANGGTQVVRCTEYAKP